MDIKLYIYITKWVKQSMVIETFSSTTFPSIMTFIYFPSSILTFIYLSKVITYFKKKNI